MEKTQEKYESPRFQFQNMRLMERVAEKCWGFNYVFIDHDANPETPAETYYWITESSGCQGNSDPDAQKRIDELNKYMAEHHKDFVYEFTKDDVKTNVKDSAYLDPPIGVSN